MVFPERENDLYVFYQCLPLWMEPKRQIVNLAICRKPVIMSIKERGGGMYLETERLILRKPEMTDVEDYLEFINSEFVMRYNAMMPVSREKAERQFADAGDDFSTIAMEYKQTGKVIGMIYVGEDSLRFGVNSKEISYFLREDESRKGYMKEALGAVIAHFFETEALTCIAARCFAPNVASQRLLESLGFQRDGVVRKCVKGYGGVVFDDCLYSLLRIS